MKLALTLGILLVTALIVSCTTGNNKTDMPRNPQSTPSSNTSIGSGNAGLKLTCPDGELFFNKKDEYLQQLEMTFGQTKYCTDAISLAELCADGNPKLMVETRSMAASRCVRDFARSPNSKKGYENLVKRCEELWTISSGTLMRMNISNCYVNAAKFYSDFEMSQKDFKE